MYLTEGFTDSIKEKENIEATRCSKINYKRNLNMSIDLHTLPWLVNNKNEKIRKEKIFQKFNGFSFPIYGC